MRHVNITEYQIYLAGIILGIWLLLVLLHFLLQVIQGVKSILVGKNLDVVANLQQYFLKRLQVKVVIVYNHDISLLISNLIRQAVLHFIQNLIRTFIIKQLIDLMEALCLFLILK